MPRTTTSIALSVAALALVVGLAACGSSSGSDSGKKTTTTEASGGNQQGSTTTAGDDDTSTTEEDATTTVVATGGGKFCDELADYINETAASDIDVTDPAAYKKAIEESTKKGKEILSKAPDELDDSVQTVLDAQDELIAELEKVDYDYTKLPTDALGAMGTPEVAAAGEKLDSYVTDTCGIELETPEVSAPEMPDVTAATIPSN